MFLIKVEPQGSGRPWLKVPLGSWCPTLPYSPFLESELLAALTPRAALPAAFLLFFRDPTPTSTVTSSSDSSSWYTSTAPSGPLLLMQHSHPTLAFKPLILSPPTLYLLPLHPHHCLMLLAAGCFSLPPAFSSLP